MPQNVQLIHIVEMFQGFALAPRFVCFSRGQDYLSLWNYTYVWREPTFAIYHWYMHDASICLLCYRFTVFIFKFVKYHGLFEQSSNMDLSQFPDLLVFLGAGLLSLCGIMCALRHTSAKNPLYHWHKHDVSKCHLYISFVNIFICKFVKYYGLFERSSKYGRGLEQVHVHKLKFNIWIINPKW